MGPIGASELLHSPECTEWSLFIGALTASGYLQAATSSAAAITPAADSPAAASSAAAAPLDAADALATASSAMLRMSTRLPERGISPRHAL